MNLKGSLTLLILHTLSVSPSHGYGIAKAIKSRSEGILDFKEGTLYPTLHSMEKQGWIEAYEEEVKGRTRRYYRLTETGRAQLEIERTQWQEFSVALNTVLEGVS